MKEQFGDFFRRLRKTRGFKSQKELSKATGISQASISRIEDNSQTPTPETLKVFARVLNFSYSDLMVRAGYWKEEDLLGEEIKDIDNLYKTKKEDSLSARESVRTFIHSLSLDDEDLLKKFELTLDGKPISQEEAKGVIAYLRSLRALKKE